MDFNITSDFVSGFWNIYVIAIVLLSILVDTGIGEVQSRRSNRPQVG